MCWCSFTSSTESNPDTRRVPHQAAAAGSHSPWFAECGPFSCPIPLMQPPAVSWEAARRYHRPIQCKIAEPGRLPIFRSLHQALPHGIQLFLPAMPSPSREEPTVRTALTGRGRDTGCPVPPARIPTLAGADPVLGGLRFPEGTWGKQKGPKSGVRSPGSQEQAVGALSRVWRERAWAFWHGAGRGSSVAPPWQVDCLKKRSSGQAAGAGARLD